MSLSDMPCKVLIQKLLKVVCHTSGLEQRQLDWDRLAKIYRNPQDSHFRVTNEFDQNAENNFTSLLHR